MVFGLFVASISLAWAWFHLSPGPSPNRLRLEALSVVPGYRFEAIQLRKDIIDQLSLTTNTLINGVFHNSSSGVRTPVGRVTAFCATWSANSAREMSVVQHTPDVCWAGAGAIPIAIGQPSSVSLELQGGSLSFECRVFAFPQNVHELVLWSTLISGQRYEETTRFIPLQQVGETPPITVDPGTEKYAAGRRVVGNQFLNAVVHRIPGNGEKQFIRFSAPLEGRDWTSALAQLRSFATHWLSLHSTTESNTNLNTQTIPSPQAMFKRPTRQ